MSLDIDPRLVSIAISELPNVIGFIRSAFTKAHPDAPVPTDEEVHAAYISARDSSLAKDDAWLAAHGG